MPAPDLEFRRIAIWVFSVMVIFPGFWIAVYLATFPLLDNDWVKLPLLLYFAIPAALAIFTEFGQAHFTFWLPQPISGFGWLLLFLFYSVLSYFVARVIFRVRTRRERTNVSD